MTLNNDILRSKTESEEHWREWCGKLPYLHFKEKYEVKIIPPFAGALARFVVKYNDKLVSVYFDGYSKLGWMYDNNDEPIPYFEAYPIEDDTRRYFITDSDQMMKDIESELEGEN